MEHLGSSGSQGNPRGGDGSHRGENRNPRGSSRDRCLKGNNPRYGNRSPKGSRPGSRNTGTPTEKILELKREKLR